MLTDSVKAFRISIPFLSILKKKPCIAELPAGAFGFLPHIGQKPATVDLRLGWRPLQGATPDAGG